jgi:hypothetical protein
MTTTDIDTDTTLIQEEWRGQDEAPLPPPRPRRRLTPLTGGLLAVLLLAAGFVGGALVQMRTPQAAARLGRTAACLGRTAARVRRSARS